MGVPIAGARVLLTGASGGIGSFYNLVPELFLQIWEASRQHGWEGAQTAQNRVNELIEIVLDFPMISAIKTILRWSGYCPRFWLRARLTISKHLLVVGCR